MSLIDRLRDPNTQWPSCDPCYLALREEAADRIERLEKALVNLTREATAVADDHHNPRYTRLDQAIDSAIIASATKTGAEQ